ncbi:MAG: hypothetical protein AAGE84_04185 [Cyanobacteria bacterium P01_G01_bin.39]
MSKIGAKVEIINPEYARGITGIIIAREQEDVWIIRLNEVPDRDLPNNDNQLNYPWLLSLPESDFNIIG